MKLFLTNSASHLQRPLRKQGFKIGRVEFRTFADGEHAYRLKESVEGEPVGVVGSILPDPRSLFDLAAIHRLARENRASETFLVVPYLGYARQDRPDQPGAGSIGLMVIELLQSLRPSRMLLLDVHSDLIRRAFEPWVKELSCLSLFTAFLSNRPPDVVVSPDAGYLSKAKELAGLFDSRPDVAAVDKVRPRPNRAIATALHGDVRDKSVLFADDIIDTGRTLAEAVRIAVQEGAGTIRLAATHGIFSDDARLRLSQLPVAEIIVTNTLPQVRHPKIRILDISSLIREALFEPRL